MAKKKSDQVNSPEHYTKRTSGGVQPIDIIAHLSLCAGTAVKYLCRAGLKGDSVELHLQDLAKAKKYLDFEIARVKGEPISDTLREQAGLGGLD